MSTLNKYQETRAAVCTKPRRAFADVTNRAPKQQNKETKGANKTKRTVSAPSDDRIIICPKPNDNDAVEPRAEENIEGTKKRTDCASVDDRVVIRPRPNNNVVIKAKIEDVPATGRSETTARINLAIQNYFAANGRNEVVQPRLEDYQHTGRTDDIDARDAGEVLSVTPYVNDLYEYHRSKERDTSPSPSYMDKYTSINSSMREILIDWLVDVHWNFKMMKETLYLCVSVIDRYLERETIERNKLQLVGATALLLASKYEEIYTPSLSDLIHTCDGAYNDRDILTMEVSILKTLKYNMTVPSAHIFLVRYLKAGHTSRRIAQYSSYILDSTLQHYVLLKYLPSQLAAAAVMIARAKEKRHYWSPTLLKYTSYFKEDIIPVARTILICIKGRGSHVDAVERKYTPARFGAVAGTEFHI